MSSRAFLSLSVCLSLLFCIAALSSSRSTANVLSVSFLVHLRGGDRSSLGLEPWDEIGRPGDKEV